MYPSLLVLHSWFRWLALGGVAVVFVRSLRSAVTGAAWKKNDFTWMKGAAHALTLQVAIGVLLYAVSPLIRSLLDNMRSTMSDGMSRLFAVEHGAAMILAVGATHMSAVFVKKAPTDTAKHSRVALSFGVALALIWYGIPWTRPWFRGIL